MRRIGIALLLGIILAPILHAQEVKTGLTSEEKKQAEDLYKQYFAAKAWDDRSKILEQLAAIDHPSKSDVQHFSKRAFALARQGPPVEIKGAKQKCSHPDYPGTYAITLGSAKSGKPTGLFISLHGGGEGAGDGGQIQGLFGSPGQGMINVYPTVIQKETAAWNKEREEQYVLAIIDELKRTFVIDTNRIYLAGHSMGGYGTWSIGPRHADLFAAISPMAGGIFMGGPKQIESGITYNLKNTPIWFYNSMDDQQVRPDSSVVAAEQLEDLKTKYGAFDFVWKKYDDIGHGTPKDGLQPIWTWMMTKKRDPLPKRVLWHSSRAYKRHFYWVRRPAAGGSDVDVERDGNKITVRAGGDGLWLMVNEKMIKFDQPVQVIDDKGKELSNAKVAYSLRAVVESIAAKNDPEMWFSGWIELK